jgi:hypothetical protein
LKSTLAADRLVPDKPTAQHAPQARLDHIWQVMRDALERRVGTQHDALRSLRQVFADGKDGGVVALEMPRAGFGRDRRLTAGKEIGQPARSKRRSVLKSITSGGSRRLAAKKS